MCRNLHLCFCAQCRFVISAFGKIFALQICAFCARRFFAHLQICVLHICTFAHFWKWFCEHVEKVFQLWILFANMREHAEMFFFTFLQKFTKSVKFAKISKKSKFPKMSDSVPSVFDVFPKMSEKSSRVPEWYTSGSWANAFDNTGWQKSPEYALIRIAAGAPDLAKSPNPPPDGPGRPRKSRHFSLRTEKLPDLGARARFCSPGWNPFRSCFSWSAHNSSESSNGFRGASSSATESDTFCKCAHTSQNTRWKPPSGPTTSGHTVHTVHNRNRHTCTNCAHRNTDVHTCAHRATIPKHIGREHIVHVLLLLGGWEVRSVHEQ